MSTLSDSLKGFKTCDLTENNYFLEDLNYIKISELDHGIKLIKTIALDGKNTSFRMWSPRFQSKMDLQGHGHIFGEKTTIPYHYLSNLDSDLELRKLFNSNKVVYSELIFAIQDDFFLNYY